ncbi:LPO_1073/Vpar_1526 family protein [Clavibacter sp. VKM Ac-2542]|uniref:LPO_1073/Vpar_1526 family protein n=1 Tax=Clavibacter sp. VKM Ac-2542 TaxID=2783811 RepID=UPI00188C66E4|nr:LPO_1073/Vpar_1526 family protein [Clavibacter sp. VKM Ac-2542]MBF4621504.1 hypothetical protein [Clavibacter sp. VKM Ac-2542]
MHGLSLSDTRQVALDVFRANSVELQGIAQTIAVARAEQLTQEFLERLFANDAHGGARLADPDMQNVLFTAQKEFARSGEVDLKEALIALLSSRASLPERDLQTLALNEAIVSAPKLTEAQRRALAWIFFLKHTRITGASDVDSFYQSLSESTNALGVDVPIRRADYQHMEYVGVGAIGLTAVSFGSALLSDQEPLFTTGFSEAAVAPPLFSKLRDAGLLMTCRRNIANFQIDVRTETHLKECIESAGLNEDLAAIQQLSKEGRMTDEAVGAEAITRVPALQPFASLWNAESDGINNVNLTSVGIALGHAYWSRLTGSEAPLSLWL